MWAPLPSNITKHVFVPPEGSEEKLNLDIALKMSKAREAEVLPVTENVVFQDPGKWTRWNTR